MNRRRFLISGLTGIGITVLAGCSDTEHESENEPSSEDESESTDSTDEPPYELDFRPDNPERIEPLEYSVSLGNPETYPDEPFEIEVTLTNTGENDIRYGDVRRVFFDGSVDPPYTLIHTESDVEFEFDSTTQQWYTTEEYIRPTDAMETQTLTAGESHTNTVILAYNRKSHEQQLQTDSTPFRYSFSTLVRFVDESAYQTDEDLKLTSFPFQIQIHEL